MKTILRTYKFDMSNPEQSEQYGELVKNLRGMGLVKVSFSNFNDTWWEDYDGAGVRLDDELLFNNQWNTKDDQLGSEPGRRVFDWYEDYRTFAYRTGYYLEQTDEMRTARESRFKCGYCGKQYVLPAQKYCHACLGSKYLEQEQLYLLKLCNIREERRKQQRVPEKLIEAYNEAQNKRKAAEYVKQRNATIGHINVLRAFLDGDPIDKSTLNKALHGLLYASHEMRLKAVEACRNVLA